MKLIIIEDSTCAHVAFDDLRRNPVTDLPKRNILY